MPDSPVDPHASSPSELKERLNAERSGLAFVVFRDEEGRQQILPLGPERERVTLGRGPGMDVRLAWDPEVSRLHAELECRGGEWTVVDDGLSANGTWLNGEPVRGRRRVCDGDSIRIGQTIVVFRSPAASGDTSTRRAVDGGAPPAVSEAQKRVLIALARPYRAGGAFAMPATNQAIADELFLTVDAVKAHLRALFDRFGIADLPQNRKRTRLVELAFLYGVVSEHDFGS
jgi:hypothetical protein